MNVKPTLMIGWKERIDFPAWGVRNVRAKVDTGAHTTALDVVDLEVTEVAPGRTIARFRPVMFRCETKDKCQCEAEVVRMARVKNTSGIPEMRPVIETEIRIGSVRKRIQITLTDRSRMRSPVILGRTALADDFVVDVSKSYLLRRK